MISSIRRWSVVVAALSLEACRGCDGAPKDERATVASSQSPLPVGLLGPAVGDAGRFLSERLGLAVRQHEGEWFELQPVPNDAPDAALPPRWSEGSRFVRADAMALLNTAIARAVRGYDPLGSGTRIPREELAGLRLAIDKLRTDWMATRTLSAAQREWTTRASVIAELASEEEWLVANSAFTTTLDRLAAFVSETEAAGKALWILPPVGQTPFGR